MSNRQRLRPWLEDRINSGEVPGLEWRNGAKTEFKITWKHAGKPDFNLDTDAALFRMWAEHTGKYKPGEQPDPSTWKTRFRCALHKMPDIEEVRVPHSLDENVPYRVFRLKPRVASSPKPRKNSINHFSVPCHSPPMSEINGFSYPPNGYHGMMCSQKTPVTMTMGYTNELQFPFPSPISSNTPSPSKPADFNGILFDDIDGITPTLPPMPFILDQQLDHVGLRQQQQPIPAMNDDFLFKTNAGQYNPASDYEPTLTELQTVSREQFYTGSCSGAVSSEAMPAYLPYSMAGSNGQNFIYPGQNGSSSSHQMGLLNMLHSQPPPLEMIQEIGLATPVSADMDMPYSSPLPDESQLMMSYPARKKTVDQNNNHNSWKNREIIWSCSVYYNNQKVSTFELNSKHTWKICYQKPDKPVEESCLKQSSNKLILLPESQSTDEEIQAVLDDLGSGLFVEMLYNGVTWITKSCQSKVFMSRGCHDVIKLSRDTRTKVLTLDDLEDKKRSDVKFMLSIGEEPLGALVKIVLSPVHATS